MGLLGSLFGEDTGDKLLRAMAIRNKDFGAAATISGDIRERKQDRRDSEEAKALEAELTSLLEDEFMTQGFSREDSRRQARLAILNTKDVGSNISSRLGTQKVSQGDDVYFGRNKVISREPKAETLDDNAGNRWRRDGNGRYQLDFIDQAPKQFVVDNQLITTPNPYSGSNVGAYAPGYSSPTPEFDVGGGVKLSPPRLGQPSGPVQIRTADDYNRLPPGTEYIDPQGRRRRKQ